MSQCRILAGAQTENVFFDEVAAYEVAQSDRTNGKKHPQPAPLSEIDGHKHQHEQVKRDPGIGLACQRHQSVEKRTGHAVVNKEKQFAVNGRNGGKQTTGDLQEQHARKNNQ